jgi:hypothetical protein
MLSFFSRRWHTTGMLPALASESALDGFLQAFRDGTLARGEWTHAAHVAVAAAWIYEEPATALNRLRRDIRRYNEAAGVANTETSGYHETLTRFWVIRIGETMERGRDRLEAVREAVARYGPQSGLFRSYYSFDVAGSVAARRAWMEPDLPG